MRCRQPLNKKIKVYLETAKYSHITGVTTLQTHLDNSQNNVAKILRKNGYSTAIVGKWHLGQGEKHHPTGFDYWNVLPGQGDYFDPKMIEMGEKKVFPGYVTDIITDKSLEFLKQRDKNKPFNSMVSRIAEIVRIVSRSD